ncbi:MAG: AEC family transporter [Polyangiales bacterium]
MRLAGLAPVIAGFVGVLLAGVWLRRTKRLGLEPDVAAALLAALVIDVTLPALTFEGLLRKRLDLALALAVVPPTVAELVVLALAWALGRAMKLSPPALGAVILCAGFSNTAFVGLPLTASLLPGDATALQTAILIDAVDTTALLWTLGVALAARFGDPTVSGPRPRTADVLTRPATLAMFLGGGLSALGLTPPGWALAPLRQLGAATIPLVFVVLGLRLSFDGVRERLPAVGLVVLLRLVVAPAIALGLVHALGLHGPRAVVSVLQAAMPSALVGSMIATRMGCDDRLSSAAVVGTFAASVPALAAWSAATSALLN